ncbi:MAG: hypothetical protein OEV92_09595, partial [Nitrospinota bacterium]|nr:hypothetical protein [Nitrospinota bacterium]
MIDILRQEKEAIIGAASRKILWIMTAMLLMTVAIIWMAREVISPDVGLLARENPKTTAFIELRKAQWRQKG